METDIILDEMEVKEAIRNYIKKSYGIKGIRCKDFTFFVNNGVPGARIGMARGKDRK